MSKPQQSTILLSSLCSVLVACVFPTDRSQDFSVQMDQLPALFVGDEAQLTARLIDRRFQITAESRFQRIDRKVSGVEVPIQLTVARFGFEFGF